MRGGIVTFALLAGCGGAPASAPSTPITKASAPSGAAEIYAVDWPVERRANLELAMKDHVAVLAHEGASVRLLEDCKPSGPAYESARQPVKEDVVRLETFAEVKRTLVFMSAQGRVEAEMSKGAVVELAVAVAGTAKATRETIRRTELTGDCQGATHFVKNASVGAFALTTGTRDKRRVAAEIFTATISTTNTSTAKVEARDGSLEDCRAGKASGCRALVQLSLAPVSD